MLNLWVQAVFWHASSVSRAQRSQKFVEDDKFTGNRELCLAILPYTSVIHGVLNLGRPAFVLIALKFPQIWKYCFEYQMLTMIVKELMPVDYGDTHLFQLMLEHFVILVAFTYHAKIDIVLGMFTVGFAYIGCRSVLYKDDKGIWTLIFAYLLNMVYLIYTTLLIYLMLSWIGFLYINSELPRTAHESLLNNIKDGVFIVDEKNSNV